MAVKKRRGRPRKSATTTAKKTVAKKRGRPAKKKAVAKAPVKRGRPAKKKMVAKAPVKRGRPAKAKTVAKKTATKTVAKRKTARKLGVGDCSGKLTRSRLVGGYALKKRVRKPKMARRGRPRK